MAGHFDTTGANCAGAGLQNPPIGNDLDSRNKNALLIISIFVNHQPIFVVKDLLSDSVVQRK